MSTDSTRGAGPDTLTTFVAKLVDDIDAAVLKAWAVEKEALEAVFQVRLDAVQSQLATAKQEVDALRSTLEATDGVVVSLENIVRAQDALLNKAVRVQGDKLDTLLALLERAKQRMADLKSTTT